MTTNHEAHSGKGGGNSKRLLAALFAAVLGTLALAIAITLPAKAAQEAVGPKDPAHGFPFYYQDSNGLLLEICIDGPPFCLEGLPNRRQPAFVATRPARSNFPDEAFWWAGEASIERPNGGRALLVLAREAAFANEVPRRGDQVSFSRVRVRVDNLVRGARYTVTHPYGTDTFVAEDDGKGGGEINFTEDIGCGISPNPNAPGCNFRDALFGRVDPFLTWNTFGTTGPGAPPRGYVGDPRVEHRVTGSPNGTNFFQIVGPNAGGPGRALARTDLFSIQGKIAGRIPTALSLKTSPSEVRLGRATTLSGNLTAFRRPLAARTVTILRKPKGAARFTAIGRRTTNVNGFFSLKGVKPRSNTTYRATFAGQRPRADQPTGVKASSSSPKKVTVRR